MIAVSFFYFSRKIWKLSFFFLSLHSDYIWHESKEFIFFFWTTDTLTINLDRSLLFLVFLFPLCAGHEGINAIVLME